MFPTNGCNYTSYEAELGNALVKGGVSEEAAKKIVNAVSYVRGPWCFSLETNEWGVSVRTFPWAYWPGNPACINSDWEGNDITINGREFVSAAKAASLAKKSLGTSESNNNMSSSQSSAEDVNSPPEVSKSGEFAKKLEMAGVSKEHIPEILGEIEKVKGAGYIQVGVSQPMGTISVRICAKEGDKDTLKLLHYAGNVSLVKPLHIIDGGVYEMDGEALTFLYKKGANLT